VTNLTRDVGVTNLKTKTMRRHNTGQGGHLPSIKFWQSKKLTKSSFVGKISSKNAKFEEKNSQFWGSGI